MSIAAMSMHHNVIMQLHLLQDTEYLLTHVDSIADSIADS